jgi:folate-binding protein YgfZ
MTLQDDDRTLHEGAAIGAIEARQQIAVAGNDRASYLQGLLSNDIQALAAGGGCYAAWLTPQGRMLTDMHVLQSDSMILLDVPAAQAEATLQRLDQFLFSEDVRLGAMSETLASVWLHGPTAGGVLEQVLSGAGDLATWPQYRHEQVQFGADTVVLARIDQLGVAGFCVFLERTKEEALRSALEAAGAVAVSSGALEIARIEAGYPLFGIDMTEDTIPLEAEIQDRAISQTKGCYVGQEIIIRVLHRGGGRVARKLVGLSLAGAVPDRGAKIFSGDREIGFVTSAAQSPRLGAIALGYVHRDFTAAGTAVQVKGDAGVEPAQVTERPMRSAA